MLQMISEQKEQNGEKYSLLQGLGQQHLFAEQLYDKSHMHVRKLNLSNLCFSLNFYFLMFLRHFLLCVSY